MSFLIGAFFGPVLWFVAIVIVWSLYDLIVWGLRSLANKLGFQKRRLLATSYSRELTSFRNLCSITISYFKNRCTGGKQQ